MPSWGPEDSPSQEPQTRYSFSRKDLPFREPRNPCSCAPKDLPLQESQTQYSCGPKDLPFLEAKDSLFLQFPRVAIPTTSDFAFRAVPETDYFRHMRPVIPAVPKTCHTGNPRLSIPCSPQALPFLKPPDSCTRLNRRSRNLRLAPPMTKTRSADASLSRHQNQTLVPVLSAGPVPRGNGSGACWRAAHVSRSTRVNTGLVNTQRPDTHKV